MIKTSAFETALIGEIGQGLPLVKQPYLAIAQQLGCDERDVIETIKRIKDRGELKRFGVVVRHRNLGYRSNGMVVWNIPDRQVTKIGQRISRYDFVTLCYRRPRRPPTWPYNLFCMIHGQDRDKVIELTEFIANECSLSDFEHRILFSKRCFKQRGAVYRQRQEMDGEISDEFVSG